MNKEEIIAQITSVKEEMKEIINTCEEQKRSLSEDEQTAFETKKNELENLKNNLSAVELREKQELNAAANSTQSDTKNKRNKTMEKTYIQNLAQQISDVANERNLEGYNNVIGKTISLRGDAYTQYGDVDDVQRQEWTRVIEPLQNAVIFDKLGMTFINTGNLVNLPSVNAVTCTINGENTALETQKIEYSKKNITPVRLGCAVGLSNTAIKTIEQNVDIVSYALKAMREAEARLINKLIFSPVAVQNDGQTVKGPFVDILAGDASVAGIAKWENILALETAVKKKNAVITERAAFVMSPDTADKLRSKKVALKGDAAAHEGFIMKDGKIDGIPVFETNEVNKLDASANVEYSYIGFCSDFSTLIVQEVGAPDLIIDPFTKSKANETELVLNDNLGFKWERDACFSAMKITDSSSWTI